MRYKEQPPLLTALGVLVAGIALVGSQVLGWEWGDGRLVPTVIGLVVAGIALSAYLRQRGS